MLPPGPIRRYQKTLRVLSRYCEGPFLNCGSLEEIRLGGSALSELNTTAAASALFLCWRLSEGPARVRWRVSYDRLSKTSLAMAAAVTAVGHPE
jgi:hypothetical protein